MSYQDDYDPLEDELRELRKRVSELEYIARLFIPNHPRPYFEKKIRHQLGKPFDELTEADLAKVTRLNLCFSRTTTDESLKEVAKLQNLTSLDVTDTKVTEAGVAELKKALPKCIILGP